jgi:hypothetical protein
MFMPSVAVEQEAADRRPMFAPALLRRSRPPARGVVPLFEDITPVLSSLCAGTGAFLSQVTSPKPSTCPAR